MIKRIFVSSLLLLLLAAGCNRVNQQNQNSPKSEEPIVITSTQDTSKWETYTNTKYHYTVKYEPGSELSELVGMGVPEKATSDSDNISFRQKDTPDSGFSIRLDVEGKMLTEEYIRKNFAPVTQDITITQVRIGNMHGYKAVVNYPGTISDFYYFQRGNGPIFDIAILRNDDLGIAALTTLNLSPDIYTNTQFGFTLNLNDKWKGYKTEEVIGSTSSYIAFSIPMNSSYADQFAILIYPKSEWNKRKNTDKAAYISMIGQNDKYVFAYQLSTDATPKLPNLQEEVLKVVSTFKLVK